EHAIDKFRIGQDVSVELWSQPGEQIPARIRELSPAADSQSRTFAARVAFSGGTVPAELGQSARVYMRSNGEVPLSVPLSALTSDKDIPYVWVVDPATSSVIRTPVRVGSY